jgi:hypothetical protein
MHHRPAVGRKDDVAGRAKEAKKLTRKEWIKDLVEELLWAADLAESDEERARRRTPSKGGSSPKKRAYAIPAPADSFTGVEGQAKRACPKYWYLDKALRLTGHHFPYPDSSNNGAQCALCAHTYNFQFKVKVFCPTCGVSLHLGECWARAHRDVFPKSTYKEDKAAAKGGD